MMKLLVILAVALATVNAQSAEQKVKAREHAKHCIGTTGVARELALKLEAGEEVTDPKIYDFSNCWFKHAGFYNEASELQDAVVVAKLTEGGDTNAAAHLETCKSHTDSNPGKYAYNLYRCYKAETGSNFL